MSVTTTNTYYSLSRIFGLCVKGTISLGLKAALKYSPIVMQNSILKRDAGTRALAVVIIPGAEKIPLLEFRLSGCQFEYLFRVCLTYWHRKGSSVYEAGSHSVCKATQMLL
jgi:hypothetical protein